MGKQILRPFFFVLFSGALIYSHQMQALPGVLFFYQQYVEWQRRLHLPAPQGVSVRLPAAKNGQGNGASCEELNGLVGDGSYTEKELEILLHALQTGPD